MTPEANVTQPPDQDAAQAGPAPPVGYLPGRWFSFKAALSGAAYTLRTQPNARIELLAVPVVTLAGWRLQISRLEWAMLGLAIAVIFALEAVNTAVEATVDLASPGYHPLAKAAKDAAAGAMVFAVLGSLWIGLLIFGPRLWDLLL